MNSKHPLSRIPLDPIFGPQPGIRLEPMTRRRATRRARRLQVHFWKQGETHAYPGYTTNLSTTGMFIATNNPLSSGTRVRIEILDRERSFMLEGVVAHARKIRGELMRIAQSGMGVRFLSVEELVRELLPGVPGEPEEDIPYTPATGSQPPSVEMPRAPEIPREPVAAQPVQPPVSRPAAPVAPPTAAVPEPPMPPRSAATLASAAPKPTQVAPPRPVGGSGLFSVHFANPRDFVEVFRRDILNGGLFVPTRYPGRLQETVEVELQTPDPAVPPIRFKARVVQRYDPHSEDLDGTNLLSGMGLELLDVPGLIERLRPLVARFEQQGLTGTPPVQ